MPTPSPLARSADERVLTPADEAFIRRLLADEDAERRWLRTLVAYALSGQSCKKAAQRLGRDHTSSVSRQLIRLGAVLGYPVFAPRPDNKRGTQLTPEGEAVFELVKDAFDHTFGDERATVA